MKKRLLCLMLCIFMTLPVLLTGCAQEEENPDVEEDTSAKTITMWVITDEKTTQEAMDEVEAAFTKLSKSDFKINVDLRFYTEEEYYTILEETINKSVESKAMAEQVSKELKDYVKAAKALGETDEDAIEDRFFSEHPEYVEYREVEVEEETGVIEDETIVNDLGITEIKYPDPDPYQVDIIYISGYQKYIEYIQANDGEGWLHPLDSELSGSAIKLNDYISSALLNGVKIDGTTYAIPNNVAIGEYTYMLVDKVLFDRYYYRYDDISGVDENGNALLDPMDKGILACDDFLVDIMTIENKDRAENGETPVVPINSTFDECMEMLVWYWNLGFEELEGDGVDEEGNPIKEYKYSYDTTNKFSILGTVYRGPEYRNRGSVELGFNSLLGNSSYRNILLKLMEYKYNDYFGTPEEGQQSAVSFLKGDYTIREEFEANDGVYTDENGKQYYAVVAKYPEATEEDLYGNMFGVCSYSNYLSQSMEIITALNTDARYRNLLQYGIEGKHYEIDENTKVLRRLNNDYMMDIEKTGNCFIAHPEEGLPADYWDTAKVQNNETLVNPLLGFNFDSLLAETEAKLDNDLITYTNMLSAQVYEQIQACESYDELEDLLNNVDTGLAKKFISTANPSLVLEDGTTVSVNLTKMYNKAYDTATAGGTDDEGNPIPDETGESPYTIYYNWLTTYGYAPQ